MTLNDDGSYTAKLSVHDSTSMLAAADLCMSELKEYQGPGNHGNRLEAISQAQVYATLAMAAAVREQTETLKDIATEISKK